MLADEIQELREEVRMLRQKLERIVAVGEIVEVDEILHRVRVKLPDRDIITGFLHVLVPVSHQTYFYRLPKVGDTVLCVFLPHGIEDGFVIGSYYHKQEEAPVKNRNKFYKRFADGTVIEYDEAGHFLLVSVQGDILVEATGNVTIKGSRIDLNP